LIIVSRLRFAQARTNSGIRRVALHSSTGKTSKFVTKKLRSG
jgi:hypothetical protein